MLLKTLSNFAACGGFFYIFSIQLYTRLQRHVGLFFELTF